VTIFLVFPVIAVVIGDKANERPRILRSFLFPRAACGRRAHLMQHKINNEQLTPCADAALADAAGIASAYEKHTWAQGVSRVARAAMHLPLVLVIYNAAAGSDCAAIYELSKACRPLVKVMTLRCKLPRACCSKLGQIMFYY
jgi:hypothetical protein